MNTKTAPSNSLSNSYLTSNPGYWRRPLTNKGGLSIDPCVRGPKRRSQICRVHDDVIGRVRHLPCDRARGDGAGPSVRSTGAVALGTSERRPIRSITNIRRLAGKEY